MYDVALSVLACLRANTDVHVAWIPSTDVSEGTETVALTPGGGQIGSLKGGAFDDAIAEALPLLGPNGGVIDVAIGPAESLVSGFPQGMEVRVAVVSGAFIPHDVWVELAERRPVSFAFGLRDREFVDFERLDGSASPSEGDGRRIVCRYAPVPRVLITGSGPIVDSLGRAFELVGWKPMIIADVTSVGGVAATLSSMDGVIVMGHDVETSGRALEAAIASNVGYIGSIGSQRMQELREEWLAYRGVPWDHRIHGPAGIEIGASSPGEIAVSIVAEAVASLRLEDQAAE